MGDNTLTKNPQSKDDSLEALDFIVNVLKEHERDLDKFINEVSHGNRATRRHRRNKWQSGKSRRKNRHLTNRSNKPHRLTYQATHQKKHYQQQSKNSRQGTGNQARS